MNAPRAGVLLGEASELARTVFGSDLRVAFIGGSHAAGTAGATSDIDTFVVLRHPDPAAERDYARALRALHDRAALAFGHCGEVFDQRTLARLLTFTDTFLTSLPGIQDVACYQADCLLSVFRKGDIVFKFLIDPKVHVVGDTDYLAGLETQARDYFTRFPRARVQRLKGRLHLDADGPRCAALDGVEALVRGDRWTESPVGVGLHRWFAVRQVPAAPVTPAWGSPPGGGTGCPLDARLDHPHEVLLRAQCLAHPAPTAPVPAHDHPCSATEATS